MAITATIKFTQGATTASPGTAVIGAAGSVVTLTNGDNSNVTYWSWQLLDKPAASALAIGPISEGAASSIATFTPDVAGCYRILLSVKDVLGNTVQQIRNFAIRNTRGWIVPSYKSGADEMNFGGNLRGGSTYLDEIFADLKTTADSPRGLTARGPYSGATAYVLNDFITSAGAAYRCILATTGNAPPNATYWEIYSSSGLTVSGTPVSGQSVTYDGTVYRPMVVQSPNVVSVFGAVGDGTTSNHVLLPAAATSVGTNGGLYVPPGVYYFSTSCNIDANVIFAPGASFSAPVGVTVQMRSVTANPTQKIFGTTGLFPILIAQEVYPEWWGAVANTPGVAAAAGQDNYAAIQAMVESTGLLLSAWTFSASKRTHVCKFKSASYRCTKPVVITKPGQTMKGGGPNSTVLYCDGGSIPAFFVTPFIGTLPTVPAFFGGPGRAFNPSFSQGYTDVNGAYIYASKISNYLLPNFEAIGIQGNFLVNYTAFEVSGFIELPIGTMPTGETGIFNLGTRFGNSDGGNNTIVVALSASGQLHPKFYPKAGGTGFIDQLHPTVMVQGKKYHFTFSWDGTTARCMVGLAGAVDNPSNLSTVLISQPVTGKLDTENWTNASIGATSNIWPDGGGSVEGFANIYNFQFKNVAIRVANYVPPVAAEAFSANTYYGTNFEPHGPNGEMVAGYSGLGVINTYTPVRQGNYSQYSNFLSGVTIDGFQLAGGVYANSTTDSAFRDISVQNGGYGLWLNHCYSTTTERFNASGCMHGFIVADGGLNTFLAPKAKCRGIAFAVGAGGATIINGYLSGEGYTMYAAASGSHTVLTVIGGALTDEATNDHRAAVLLDGGEICASFLNTTIETTWGNWRNGALVYRGIYNPATAYAAFDTVRLYDGEPYVHFALAASTGVTPGTDATKWEYQAQYNMFHVKDPSIPALPAIQFNGTILTIQNCFLLGNKSLGSTVRVAANVTNRTRVSIENCAFTGDTTDIVPLTNRDDIVYGAAKGSMVNSRGISASNMPLRNHAGQVTINSSNTSAAVAFLNGTETDSNYVVTSLALSVKSGSPSAASLNQGAYVTAKTTTGFTINLPTAPGGSSAIDVGWTISRAIKGATPTVTAVTANHGTAAGGNTVTVAGTNFQSGSVPYFAGVAATLPSTVSPSSLTCVAPAGTASSYPIITVVNPDGPVSANAYGYTYDTATVAASPMSISSAIASLRADIGVILSGGNVATWSGYGMTALAPSGNRPTVLTGASGINSQNTVSFTQTQFLRAALSFASAGASVYMVYKYYTYMDGAWDIYGVSGQSWQQPDGAWFAPRNGAGIGYYSVTQGTTPSPGQSVNIASLARIGPSGCQIDLNGTTSAISGVAHPGFNTQSIILNALGTSATTVTQNGIIDIAEICVFNTYLTAGEVTTLDNYTFGRYALHL